MGNTKGIKIEEYKLTEKGKHYIDYLKTPLDTKYRDRVLYLITKIASKHPRPILFEEDFMNLANFIAIVKDCDIPVTEIFN